MSWRKEDKYIFDTNIYTYFNYKYNLNIMMLFCSVVFSCVVLFTCNEYMYSHSWGIDIAEEKVVNGRASSPGFSSGQYSTSKMSWF